jgi:hypothetical protein
LCGTIFIAVSFGAFADRGSEADARRSEEAPEQQGESLLHRYGRSQKKAATVWRCCYLLTEWHAVALALTEPAFPVEQGSKQ